MKNQTIIAGHKSVVICMLTAAMSLCTSEAASSEDAAKALEKRIDDITEKGLADARIAPNNETARGIIRRMEKEIEKEEIAAQDRNVTAEGAGEFLGRVGIQFAQFQSGGASTDKNGLAEISYYHKGKERKIRESANKPFAHLSHDYGFSFGLSSMPSTSDGNVGDLNSAEAAKISAMYWLNFKIFPDWNVKANGEIEKATLLFGPIAKVAGAFVTNDRDARHEVYGGIRLAMRTNREGKYSRLIPDYYLDITTGRTETLPNLRWQADAHIRITKIGDAKNPNELFGYIQANTGKGASDFLVFGMYFDVPLDRFTSVISGTK